MFSTRTTLLMSAALALMAFPLAAQAEHHEYNCEEHATKIDHEIGAEKAMEAYHIIHGDMADEHHTLEMLKTEHETIEHDLEQFVEHGCDIHLLEAHAKDGEHH